MAKRVYEISCAVIFNLLYTSMFSDGITLRPYPDNPIVGRHVAFECNTEIAIAGAVSIKIPNNTVIGSCIPASFPVSVSCSNLPGYKATLNESAHTLRINTSSMGSDLNGTWLCIHNAQTATYDLESPLTEIQDEFFNLSLTTFIQDITSESSISLTAVYGCINIPISFTWIVVDNSSNRIDLGGANKVQQNGSVCTAFSGFDAYTETKNVSDVYLSTSDKNLVGRHRLGVEVHYLGEVTALQRIQYFDTFFTFTPTTSSTTPGSEGTKPDNIGLVIGLVIGAALVLVSVSVLVGWRLKKFLNNKKPKSEEKP